MQRKTRQILLGFFLAIWLVVAGFGYRQLHTTSTGLTKIVLGYQKADPFDIARQRGVFAKKMKAKGYKVVWKEFQDGTALMQALKSGAVDYARTGDTPPVTSQAAGVDLVYIASGSSKAKGSAVLIPKNSKITSIQDLKGKRVAYTKGTISHYLLLSALEKAGMSATDITWVNLTNSAASVAFAQGKVDAWATWDPMTATAQVNQGAKILFNGTGGVTNSRDFILSTSTFAKNNTEVSQYLLEYLQDDMTWANEHQTKLISMLSEQLGLSKTIVKKMVTRRSYAMTAMTSAVVKEQQRIADLFYDEGLITKQITVSDAVIAVSAASD